MRSKFLNISVLAALISLSTLGIGCKPRTFNAENSSSGTKGINDIHTTKTSYDGTYDVVCLDGTSENKTKAEIQQDNVCVDHGNGYNQMGKTKIEPPVLNNSSSILFRACLKIFDGYSPDNIAHFCANKYKGVDFTEAKIRNCLNVFDGYSAENQAEFCINKYNGIDFTGAKFKACLKHFNGYSAENQAEFCANKYKGVDFIETKIRNCLNVFDGYSAENQAEFCINKYNGIDFTEAKFKACLKHFNGYSAENQVNNCTGEYKNSDFR